MSETITRRNRVGVRTINSWIVKMVSGRLNTFWDRTAELDEIYLEARMRKIFTAILAIALSFMMMPYAASAVWAGELENQLLTAAQLGKIDAVRSLVDKGANVNAKDSGLTVLSWASRYGTADVVRILIEKGAKVNGKDDYGSTALTWAAESGKTDNARVLIENGADLNVKGRNGKTALMRAAEYGYADAVRLLIEKGADINAKDEDGKTALDQAELMGRNEVAKLLSPDRTLGQYIADLQRLGDNFTMLDLRKKIIQLASTMQPSPAVPEDAQAAFVQGNTIMKSARTAADYNLAVGKYRAAVNRAPWWGNAYYNLAMAENAAGQPDLAKQWMELYIFTRPKDAAEAQNKIYEIEAQQELQKKREATVKAKYGNRQGGGYGVDDLYRYGAIVQNMSFDASGNERVISLKIVVRKESGLLRSYFQVADITSPNDVYLQKFSLDWRGTNTFYHDDRATPNKQLMTMSVTSYGDGDANITIRPANNASTSIKTTLNALLRELASQAVYAGDRLNIGGREFYVLAQGGAKGSLLFFPPEIKGMLESGSVRDMMPRLVANVNYRASDGTNQRYTNSDLGDVNGTRYHLEYVGDHYEAKPGRGEDH